MTADATSDTPFRIVKRQTTYWDFARGGKVTRVHFLKKHEHYFAEADVSGFEIVSDHPVLQPYRHPWQDIYITSRPDNPEGVLQALSEELSSILLPWRAPDIYFNAFMKPRDILQAGNGLLFSGPLPVGEVLLRCLSSHQVQARSFVGRQPRGDGKALIAGGNFVVAEDFRIE